MHQRILKNISNENLIDLPVNKNNLLLRPVPDRVIPSDNILDLFRPFHKILCEKKSIAIAVSGGADSMALCLLLADWVRVYHCRLIALTVDHELRQEAAKEARQVTNWLRTWNIGHKILNWQAKKPKTGIQSAARVARYNLMVNWCRRNNFSVLMTGHQLEDQVETFLLRVERGSGLTGLASMSALVDLEGISLIRPLLRISKLQLREFLNNKKQPWIEDPSNQSTAFQRNRIRCIVDKLKVHSLPPGRINTLVSMFADLRAQFSSVVDVFFDRAVNIMPEGYGIVHLEILKCLSSSIIERVLVRLLSELNGNCYPPRRRVLTRAVQSIRSDCRINFTLGGCRFIFRGLEIIICRELRSVSKREVVAADRFYWDDLYNVAITGSTGEKGIIGALGKRGWAEVVAKCPELRDISIPYVARITLPTLFGGRGVIEVPDLEYRSKGESELKLILKKIK